jgi:1,4-dihydroxy-2-naphthoate octaprenyltransferase
MSAVILVMLSTYYGGEAYDVREDSIAWSEGGNPFSGGSGMVVMGCIPSGQVKRASLIALLVAILIGIFLQFGLKTGPWTLPLGLTGAFAGYCYSTPPFRWVFHPLVSWLSIPIGCTIFNVILLNEFPDYKGDSQAGKKNLTVRLGLDRASHLYGMATLLAWVFLAASVFAGVPIYVPLFSIPLYLMGGKIYLQLRRGAYRDKHTLRKLCGLNLIINLGTTVLMILCVIICL